MTPAALRGLARVLGALLPWRQHGRIRQTPSPHVRLGVHREPLRWRRRRRAHFATNGSATGARRAPCPSPFFRPGGGHTTSGAAGAVKAGARAFCAPPVGLGLDRRSPPSR